MWVCVYCGGAEHSWQKIDGVGEWVRVNGDVCATWTRPRTSGNSTDAFFVLGFWRRRRTCQIFNIIILVNAYSLNGMVFIYIFLPLLLVTILTEQTHKYTSFVSGLRDYSRDQKCIYYWKTLCQIPQIIIGSSIAVQFNLRQYIHISCLCSQNILKNP